MKEYKHIIVGGLIIGSLIGGSIIIAAGILVHFGRVQTCIRYAVNYEHLDQEGAEQWCAFRKP